MASETKPLASDISFWLAGAARSYGRSHTGVSNQSVAARLPASCGILSASRRWPLKYGFRLAAVTSLSLQVQPERSPGIDIIGITELFRNLVSRIGLVRHHSFDSGYDNGPYYVHSFADT